MAYAALDNSTVLDYLRTVTALEGILPPDADLSAREVGDGNLNQVFIVQSRGSDGSPNGSVVLKQALPYLRVAGESWPLTRERMRFETQALVKHNELAPGLAPAVYHFDNEMSLVVMEDLSALEVMRRPASGTQAFPALCRPHLHLPGAHALFHI
jgi:5-methylthioribose kinase